MTEKKVGETAIEGTLLLVGARRLIGRWQMIADRLEPYAPAAAVAYRRAADDLRKELGAQGAVADAVRQFRDELVLALREERPGSGTAAPAG